MSTDYMNRERDAAVGRWMISRRSIITQSALLGLSLMLPAYSKAAGEPFASKPFQVIVPYPPGGSNDSLARLIALQLARKFQQPVLVDNRPGAGGGIGIRVLAKSVADGHTLGLVSSSFATSAAVSAKLPFDPIKDFEPVARITSSALLVLVSPHLGARDLQGFIALARQRPGKLSYGSSGVGSLNHFAAELLMDAAGVRLVHVPYRGMAPAMADLAGGHLDLVITSESSARAFLNKRNVVAIATTSAHRLPHLSTVPTCRESGLSEIVIDAWAGFLAPAGTPADKLALLNGAINEAMTSPELSKALKLEGASTFEPLTPTEFKSLVQSDIARWRKIARAKKIEAD
ncbi:Bug family tripartite tricarboxylate transporter substrate binding protein [Cupriavidus alkaliphilus]|uniref:Tripartite-type tricarboxylate transporter receptor subunit TctC n=1 Tax=Cupriavidus alkaliphilus TaxID=942866 RepID=A0A7W4VE49_9BURK|nr:tripartite tricarboxylate transporter substrate binding protein [Cupriavidus alkaliphilus]MBB3009947.1 tripartite-type tricarboxylate transporter receptor subunit TctC [Cupriavidus alkaliphilus]